MIGRTMNKTLPTRQQAIAQGLRTYQGPPCAQGHAGIRSVSNSACVECQRIYNKAYKQARAQSERERKAAWKAANPEKVKAERKRYRARHARLLADRNRDYIKRDPNGTIHLRREALQFDREIAAHERAAQREATREHRLTKQKEKARTARANRTPVEIAADKAQSRAAYRAKKEKDPEGLRLQHRLARSRRRAAARGVYASATQGEIRQLLQWQGGRCAYCGSHGPLHLDHKHPISKGGKHTALNLQWLCATCNMDKRATPDGEYRRLKGIPTATQWDAL